MPLPRASVIVCALCASALSAAACRVDPPVDTGPELGDCRETEQSWSGTVGHAIILVMDGTRIEETFGIGTTSVTTGGSEEEGYTSVEAPTTQFMPRIRAEVYPDGAVLQRALASGVTITGEGHAELLTGRRLPLGNFPSESGPGQFRTRVPTLFELVREAFDAPEDGAALVVNTVHLQGLSHSLSPAYGDGTGAGYTFVGLEEDPTQPADSDVPVVEAVRAQMLAAETRILLANLHDVDRGGHYGNLKAYPEKAKVLDAPIAELWSWIQSTEPYADDTVLVLVADHGRHRYGEYEDYRHHGDQCAGCREVPLLLAGPGVCTPLQSWATATLQDVAPTLGWLMGFDVPYASGRILSDALLSPPQGGDRTGEAGRAQTESLELSWLWRDDDDARSEITADGSTISGAGALHAEAPVALSYTDGDGTRDVACWRELHVDTDLYAEIDLDWPWQAECRTRVDGGDWSDMEVPLDQVWPFFEPALSTDPSGNLWLAYVNNPTGVTSLGVVSGVGLLRWNASDGWDGATQGNDAIYYPTDMDLLTPDGSGAIVAMASSSDEQNGRYTRHIEVMSVEWGEGEDQRWSRLFHTGTASSDGTAPGSEYARMEAPSMWGDGADELRLGFLAWTDDGSTRVVVARSEDGGATWSELEEWQVGSSALAHIRPRWDDAGGLWWLEQDEAAGYLACGRSPDDASATCQALDTQGGAAWTAVDGLAPTPSGVRVQVRDSDGAWQATEVTLER